MPLIGSTRKQNTFDLNNNVKIGVAFPLDETNIFKGTETVTEQAKSNLINLLLTNPGERVNLPNFGIGIKSLLFEQRINKSISKTSKNSLKEKIMGNSPLKQGKPFKPQSFTKNGTLNDLLNETAAGDTNLESGNSPISLAEPFATGAPMPMNTKDMPQEVANAVTRDYSSLMKAIDKKKGN